jgi:hypothetical protein
LTNVIASTAFSFARPRQAALALRELEEWRSADIKPEYWVALGAAVFILSLMVAGFSLIYVRRSAKASREQTKQQKQAAKDAAQPTLWVDIGGDDGQDQALLLLLGNSGPSIAHDVKVTFDPPPPSTLDIKPILEILKQASPH